MVLQELSTSDPIGGHCTWATGHQFSDMARKLDRLQEQFMQALEEAPLHSTLGKWMTERREALEALFREGKPDWTAMAEHFDKAGLRDEAEYRPTAGSAERTWRVVRAAAASSSSETAATASARLKFRGYPAGQRPRRVSSA